MTQGAPEVLRVGESPVPDAAGEARWRPALRVLLAIGVSVLACLLWWMRTPRALQPPIDIVGFPAFYNWDYGPSITAYRLTVYAFPIGAIVVYLLLAWRGPLRAPRVALPRDRYQPRRAAVEVDDEPRAGVGALVSTALRLLVPAGVVAIEASTRGYGTRLNKNGAAAAVLYLVIVVVAARLVAWRRGGTAEPVTSRGPLDRLVRAGRHVATANAVLAPAAVLLGFWYVSRHTGVHVGHHVQRWPWLPIWLALLGAVGVAVWVLLRLRRGQDPLRLERLTLSVVVGGVFVYLATASLPGSLLLFRGGFDDAKTMTGAQLLREGLFPWRDLLFIHGLFPDVLAGNLSQSVFGNTAWGDAAGAAAILFPASWTMVYLFTVWVGRRNGWFVVASAIVISAGWLDSMETRFVLTPAVLLVLAGTLARNSARWCVGLMTMLFALEILVPETLFLALPTAAVLVAADFVGRDPSARLRTAFRRSYWFFGTGVVLGIVWAIYLTANHALGAFVDYYVIFGPGHVASGAHGPSRNIELRSWFEFGLEIGLVLLTYAGVAVHARRRAAWTPRHWVTIAAAGFVALYGEKALGRFDPSHVAQTFTVALPLLFLWAEALVRSLERGLRRSMRRLAQQRRRLRPVGIRHPVTIAGVAVIALVLPLFSPRHSVVHLVDRMPANEHSVSGRVSPVARIGYAKRAAVDAKLLDDLRVLLDTYAGPTGRIFDMSNSLGYFYYLLERLPATKFFHISMAVPIGAQNTLIDELRTSRPSVVVFDTTTIGNPLWDRIGNDVRHYQVSRYVLRGWTPLVRVGGVLLMLRNDLVAGRPALPLLDNPAQTADLYLNGHTCDWGYVPNFLPTHTSGASITVPVHALGSRTVATVSGWAADPATRTPARSIVLVRHGRVVGSTVPSRARPDIAKRYGYGGTSGFHVTSVDAGSGLAALALTSDGRLHPLRNEPAGASIPKSVRLPDGTRVKVARSTRGRVSGTIWTRSAVGLATVPAGADMRGYDVVTFQAPRALGDSQISLADGTELAPEAQIQAHALPVAGRSLSVRASSCLQWPGFTDRRLYVLQKGGTPVTQLELSGLR